MGERGWRGREGRSGEEGVRGKRRGRRTQEEPERGDPDGAREEDSSGPGRKTALAQGKPEQATRSSARRPHSPAAGNSGGPAAAA